METDRPNNGILLVSGDYDACDDLTSALRQQGYQVDFAYDGHCALELLQQRSYAAAVLDHWPPFLDALPLSRRLARLAPEMTTVLLMDSFVGTPATVADAGDAERILPRSATANELLRVLTETAGVYDMTAA